MWEKRTKIMKKIIFSLIVLFLVSNCVLLDSLGLNMTKATIKGSEAKNQILTGALIGASSTGNSSTQITSFATYNTQKLRDNKFYDKDDVDACAEKMIIFANALSSNSLTGGIAIGQYACTTINEHKTFIDWPIPLF